MLPMVKTAVITGDFNANVAVPASTEALTLLNTIRPLGLEVVSDIPTHHTYDSQTQTHSHTTLDLFIVGRDTAVVSFSQSPAPFIAGHDFICLSMNMTTPKPPPQIITTRQLGKVNGTLLNMTLSQALHARYQNAVIGPKPAAVSSMANLEVSTFEEVISASILEVYDTLSHLRTITIPDKRKPWVTPEILNLMEERDKAHKARPYDHERLKWLRSRG